MKNCVKFWCRIWVPKLGAEFGCPIWVPNLGAEFGCRICVPNLGAEFRCRIWVPNLGAKFRCQIWEIVPGSPISHYFTFYMFYRIALLNGFSTFSAKELYWRPTKIAFLLVLQFFSKHLNYKLPLGDFFCFLLRVYILIPSTNDGLFFDPVSSRSTTVKLYLKFQSNYPTPLFSIFEIFSNAFWSRSEFLLLTKTKS